MSTTSPSYPSNAVLFTLLPGPDRKRRDSTYCYRLTYQTNSTSEPGCIMTWEVSGGRQSYQIAVERAESGAVRLHCTCADAVYRAEEEGRHCKHILGLLAFGSRGHELIPVSSECVALRFRPAASDPDIAAA